MSNICYLSVSDAHRRLTQPTSHAYPTNVAGGIVFTGVFGAFAGVNILIHPGLITTTILAATLADIDVPSSLWGRTFQPISKFINRRFGHRTITHSLLFLLVTWGIVIGACSVVSLGTVGFCSLLTKTQLPDP